MAFGIQTGINKIFGSSSGAGLLGLGQFRPEKYDIQEKAFVDPYAAQQRKQMQEALQQYQGYTGKALSGQEALIAQLQAQAAGQGPSLADEQLKQALQQSTAQNMGMMASQRGVNPAMALRFAGMSQAAMAQQAAAQAAQAKIQEQLAARQQLGSTLGQMGGMSGGLEQNYQQQLLGLNEAERQAQIEKQKLGVQQAVGMAGVEQQGYAQAGQARQNFISNLGQGITSIAASGKDLKENVKPGEKKLKELLDKAQPKEYNYKDKEKFGEGKHVSAMAEDLEKSDIGKSMVVDTKEGKMVDYGKGFGAMLAALSMLNKKIDKLEKR